MYDDAGYANGRLSGTIVRLSQSGEPIRVNRVTSRRGNRDIIVEYNLLQNMEDEPQYCNINELNLQPIPLGYVNTLYDGRRIALHAARMPVRHDWRQGARSSNIHVSGGVMRFNNLGWNNLRDTVLGVYPTAQRAARTLTENNHHSIAIDRSIALHRRYRDERNIVRYRDRLTVGTFNENGMIMLNADYMWLNEHLQGVLDNEEHAA